MKTRWIFLLILVAAFSLNACTSGSPTDTDEPYPGPQMTPTQEQSYPSPEVPQAPGVLYPDIQDGNEIPWPQVVSMILNGEVAQVTQLHSQQVTITLKDGRAFTSVQPEMDAVLIIIEQCGEKCEEIVIATE